VVTIVVELEKSKCIEINNSLHIICICVSGEDRVSVDRFHVLVEGCAIVRLNSVQSREEKLS